MAPGYIITVCIFCFICATHSPCASHVTVGDNNLLTKQDYADSNNPPIKDSSDNPEKIIGKDGNADRLQKDEPVANLDIRNKSSDVNNKNSTISSKEDVYLKKIFSKYGDGETITMEGFEKLIKRLEILSSKLEIHDHDHEDESKNVTCSDQSDLRNTIKNAPNNVIDKETFTKSCPAMVFNLISEEGCAHDTPTHLEHEKEETEDESYLIWICSIVAVFLISACGVLALAIIPVMQKRFYKPLIQFLVALAVGTLAGDALLHLLPHAMSSEHGHDHKDMAAHNANMWKGFIAMMGLTFFFVMERLILLIGKWRKKHQKHSHTHIRVVNEGRGETNHVSDTQCMDKYNSSAYCYKDIIEDSNSKYMESDRTATTVLELGSNSDTHSFKKSISANLDKIETNQNSIDHPSESNNACTEVNKMLPEKHEDVMVIIREHETNHHGHSHAHGHVHSAPQNFSAVAWMVIMGDGLHNFTDGMAIGAAFSGGLAGGFSTAVAVFCHELPHELGDFAMLLKAGMSIKQALFYNLLSSILCILGNVFGLWLGNTEHATSWVFAAASGMFLYIALVDMIPELSAAHEDEGNLTQCVLHLGGLSLGVGIMTIIALYEHDLKNMFNN